MQARAFAHPSTATAMGAHAPQGFASRGGVASGARWRYPGVRWTSHFGGKLGGGFRGSALNLHPSYGYSRPAYGSSMGSRPYYGAAPGSRGAYGGGYGGYRGAPGSFGGSAAASRGGYRPAGRRRAAAAIAPTRSEGGGYHGGGVSRGGGGGFRGGGGGGRGGGGRR